MLKVLERAIAEEGGDPSELERIREAREILWEYRQLRKEGGLAVTDARTAKRTTKMDKTRR